MLLDTRVCIPTARVEFFKIRVVLEDDVNIAEEFTVKLLNVKLFNALHAMMLRTWDILHLNATESHYGAQLPHGIYQYKGALGTYGYAIPQHRAKKLLDFAQNCDKSVDHMLDNTIFKGKINAFHTFPPLVQLIDDLTLTIESTAYE